MTPEESDRAFALFNEALERAEPGRGAFLEAACAGNPALRRHVEALLHADAEANPLFDASLAQLAAVLPESDEHAHLEGQSIGPYRILRELGRGGMGAVYLAERADVGKRVALKLVTGGLAAPGRVARFLVERRVLARLEHPHVARLLDAGVADDGTPWFAMEYVDGVTLDRYADAHRLPVANRLALFEKTCEAVAYAHRNLVVHRDLKPSNILVTAAGVPKLLDFGIARLLEEDTDEEEAGLTQTGVRPMTPDYAAPEQVLGRPITTATDVYQLGVVLYELLSGHRPYRLAGRSLGEIEQHIVREDPPKPSAMAARLGEGSNGPGGRDAITPASVARARSTMPERLLRRLSGELDAIVMKALAKEPERRYANAEGLLEDLRRYRTGQPVAARPATWGYRTRKFIGRHPAGLGVSAGFLALLIAFFSLYTIRITAARDRAEQESERAAQVANFLKEILRGADPTDAAGRQITAVELLDRSYGRIKTELEGQPEVQAELLELMSEIYTELGRFETAAEAAEQSLTLARRLYPPTDAAVVNATDRLTSALDYLGRTEEAVPYLDTLLTLLRAQRPVQRDILEGLLAHRARMSYRLGDFTRSRNEYAEVFALLQEDEDGEYAEQALTFRNNYGVLLHIMGDYADAVRIHREVYGVRLRRHGPLHTQTLSSATNLARALHGQGSWDEAEALQRETVARRRQAYPAGHPRIAAGLHYHGLQLLDQGRIAEADTALAEAARIQYAAQGPAHFETARYRAAWARTRSLLMDYTAADSLLRSALRAVVEGAGEDHYTVAEVLYAYGEHAALRGDPAAAEAYLRRAAGIQQAALGEDHPERARTLHALGALLDPSDPAAAEASFREALSQREARIGPEHPLTVQTRAALQARPTAPTTAQ